MISIIWLSYAGNWDAQSRNSSTLYLLQIQLNHQLNSEIAEENASFHVCAQTACLPHHLLVTEDVEEIQEWGRTVPNSVFRLARGIWTAYFEF